ncbi:MAG TPA: type 1 glutamine amidotransferase [Thermoleophilaceae bacterium]|nr:type 1 glutamine amidotransferase [Thermoleophilaceae bacterium]
MFADSAAAAGCELVEWLPHEQPPPALDGFGAAIVFGGAAQVDEEHAHPWLRPEKELLGELLERRIPTLGVCLGSQLIAQAAGGGARRAATSEIGWYPIELTEAGRADPLLGALPDRFEGFQYHHYEWLLPPEATVLARSTACLQAFRVDGRPAWGVQFHPEVTLADLSSWLVTWEDDALAVETGLDPQAIRAESSVKISAWNEVGRGLSARFLAQAAALTPA